MKTLYLECSMGAAGDMLMGALLELYADKEGFLDRMNHLMDDVTVRAEKAKTCGIAGTHMEVLIGGQEEICGEGNEPEEVHGHESGHGPVHESGHTHEFGPVHEGGHFHEPGHVHEGPAHVHAHSHPHSHAALSDIYETIRGFHLPDEVKEKACRVYEKIAEAEAAAHQKPVAEVHFHEVGMKDAIADVTGVCYLMYLLGAEKILASPVNLGSGQVRCAHGILPVPAPATAFLIRGIPAYTSEVKGELCTPTGAALLKTFAQDFGPMPAMSVTGIGYGIGRKKFERANCVRAFLGEEKEAPAADSQICELSANLDDMTAEALGFAQEILLKEGALDVFTTPIYMKKNRPACLLTCLCRPEEADRLAGLILLHTTTFGVRKKECERYTLAVSWEEKETPYGRIRKKIGTGYGIRKAKPEYEEAAQAAKTAGVPLSKVMQSL